MKSVFNNRLCILPVITVALLLSGCPSQKDDDQTSNESSLEGTQISLLVVDSPEMARQINLLTGSWEEKSGGTFQVTECTTAELKAMTAIEADALIAPSYLLGELAAVEHIASLPKLTESQSEQFSGYLPLLAQRQSRWGDERWSVPFGSPVFVLYYRQDLLTNIDREVPKTWEEYIETARLLDTQTAVEIPVAEPVAEHWAATAFLNHAASAASHPSNYSVLFNLDTMEPLIAGEPFVRALEQMRQTSEIKMLAEASGDEAMTPGRIRRLFWEGRCAMAITWPTAADSVSLPEEIPEGMEVGITTLPGSAKVYDFMKDRWDPRHEESVDVPILDFAGRSGMLPASSKNPEAATSLMLWLSSDEWGTQVSAVCPDTTIYRKDQLRQPGRWVEHTMEARPTLDYSKTIGTLLNTDRCVFALRVPGREEYLVTLDIAVRDVLLGKKRTEGGTQRSRRTMERRH